MSEHCSFRASPETAAAIAEAAKREGVSQSEIIRTAVEARLGVAEPDPEPDVYTLVVHAAKGELQAQRDLARVALGLALTALTDGSPKEDAVRPFIEALLMARIAAAHGTARDQEAILTIMSLAAQHCPGAVVDDGDLTDIMGRLDMLADAGTPYAADTLHTLVEGLARDDVAELVAGGKAIRARLRDEMESAR